MSAPGAARYACVRSVFCVNARRLPHRYLSPSVIRDDAVTSSSTHVEASGGSSGARDEEVLTVIAPRASTLVCRRLRVWCRCGQYVTYRNLQ
jgi:hypothetical protein